MAPTPWPGSGLQGCEDALLWGHHPSPAHRPEASPEGVVVAQTQGTLLGGAGFTAGSLPGSAPDWHWLQEVTCTPYRTDAQREGVLRSGRLVISFYSSW